MKLADILNSYSDSALDQIASDKIDEAVNLRLPRSVIIQEINSALSSLSYISNTLNPTKPPAYSFLNLILSSPDYSIPVEGFQELVLSKTKELSIIALERKELSSKKNYELYQNILKRAWEYEDNIDNSEAVLLNALRIELGIWNREHFLIEHHPDIIHYWDMNSNYIAIRNHFLITGIVLTYQNNYVIADEVAVQIQRALGIEISDSSFTRLLSNLKKEQLQFILENVGFTISGSKEDQISRIIKGFVPPIEVLELFSVEELRDYCRQFGIQVSGVKSSVIDNIINHYNLNLDIQKEDFSETIQLLPSEPQERKLDNEVFSKILLNLSNSQLYDALYSSHLNTSGTKEEKVMRLVDSPWSEINLLNNLRKNDLSLLCRKIGLNVSGVKNELVDRILDESDYQFRNVNIELSQISINQNEKEESSDEIQTPILNEIKTDALPSQFDSISNEFSELEKDEQIILSIIKETKSLNEHDIERVSLRHGLGWFLTRAHMAELISKLRENNRSVLRIKSIRSMNIYEWVDNNSSNDNNEIKSARNIIDALRNGVVPKGNLELLAVGQANTRNHLQELLEEAHTKKSPFKFIKGPYGAGKTFLCSWLKDYALKKQFVVSLVNIGPDQPLSDLPIFYSGVINGLRTPEKLESSALVDILESWILNIHKITAQIEGKKAFDSSTSEFLAPIVEKRLESELANLNDIDPGFAPAIRSFYKARIAGDQETASSAISWLNGSRSLSSQALREIGVKGYLEANQVFPRIRALLDVINGASYQGLLLIIDELELIRKFPHTRQREQALETLRLLIDESGKNGLAGCLLLFTGTDTFFEDDRAGIKSYEALSERISLQKDTEGKSSLRQPIIQLEGFNDNTLHSVVLRVREIHGLAYNWDPKAVLSDEELKNLVDDWTRFGTESINRKPRPVIRELINLLDLCEENPGVNLYEFVKVKNVDDSISIANINQN